MSTSTSPMPNIRVSRYPNPKKVGWAGWVEPDDRSWVAYIDLEGRPVFFLHRDPETGAVLPDDPEEQPAAIEAIRAEQARRKAWDGPVEGVHYPCIPGERFAGRAVPPSGRDPV